MANICNEPSRVAVKIMWRWWQQQQQQQTCLLLPRHNRQTEPTVVGEESQPRSYRRNDSGIRAYHLYDGGGKADGATAASSTSVVICTPRGRRAASTARRKLIQLDSTAAKDECMLHGSCRQGRPVVPGGRREAAG